MTGTLPPADGDQYLGLKLSDAHVVTTRALLTARENLADTVEARAMMCVYGDSGCGKTLAVNTGLRELEPAEDVRRITFRSRPTARAVRYEIFAALGLRGDAPAHPSEFDRLLKDALAVKPRTLVVDEAQWLNSEAFEYFRYLWDDYATQLAIIFVGGPGCYTVLRKEPMLASRIFIWQRFTPLTRAEVLEVIPLFHPVWENVKEEDLLFVDEHAAHGNFRNWAWLTVQVLRGLKRLGREQVDTEVVRWTFSHLGKNGHLDDTP
ncbi:ATP-binding protein [Streptomyces sp. NBC_01017]|uniref:AAA family ATPase n=1 Tax=Streptomyces sp. NBC_01017 TaxID=2903721 RepID=UPI003863D3E2|nr:ATP-binding protein [Streptomyces sp. NBC_01017]WSV35401.1 ATP-binding protein [Streptomyces sp. NBC_01017]